MERYNFLFALIFFQALNFIPKECLNFILLNSLMVRDRENILR